MKFPIFVKYSVSKNSAALSGSAMGRQQRSSRENRWNTQGNSIRRNTSGSSKPKRQGFKCWKTRRTGRNWFLPLTESPLPSGSKSNSTSYGRAYTDLYNRKGKAEGWNCRIPILNSEQINLLQHKWLSQLFITFVFGLGKLRPRHIRKERSVMLILLLKT